MQHTLFETQTSFKAPSNEAALLELIYSNGFNEPATIVFHEDGGHGWLQVPMLLVKQLGITEKISGYSYKYKGDAYLEEDCDLSLFFRAMQLDENKLSQYFWNHVPNEYNERTPVRTYPRFK